MNISGKGKKLAMMLGICFVAYNVILFVICGFKDHTPVFWMSWIFMLVAFAALAVSGVLLGSQGMYLKDWLFGFPIVKHSTIYIIAELVVSTVFIIFEDYVKFGWAFAIQFLFLSVYCIFVIAGFLSKETIDEVHNKVKDKTSFIKLLRADTEMLVTKCSDPELKGKLKTLAEEVRFSDPMSNEALFELEKEITLAVSECSELLDSNDLAKASEVCDKASLMLKERNKKCKALK